MKNSKEYGKYMELIENILQLNYKGIKFTLICNGFDIEKWEFTKVDSVDDLEQHLVELMLLCNINYMEIDWSGSKLKNFFPIDNFAQIADLNDIFEIATFNRDGFKMIELSEVITEICYALSEEFNDDSYLNLAIGYEEIIELVQSLEIQELMLMEYFTTEGVQSDEIVMLYKDFSRNLDRLESIYPGSPFVSNMARFDNDINNLELATFSEENAEYKLGVLDIYISLNYENSVFTLVCSDNDFSFVSSIEGEQPSSDLIKYTLELMDILCIEDFTLHCNCSDLEIDSDEEIPYFDDLTLFIEIKEYDKNGILKVNKADIYERFSNIHYDPENDVLAYLIDDEDLGNIDSINWERVYKPEKYSQFKEKWFYDEVGDIEEKFEEDSEDDEKYVNALIATLDSLNEKNISAHDRQSFIENELRESGFIRLCD